ncbi:MAG TPA: outer membrane beta-barrel protein [Sphingomicrobium sp.]|nr:outer membrane beta-barrel protein [Sphingomicrobium sp.]
MTYLAAAAAAFAFATPAMAQDTASTGPAAPTGFRVEALVGWDRPSIDGFHDNGILFGVGAGYDVAVGNAVSLGVDVEASDSTAKKDGVSTRRDLYAGGRVNFAVSPNANVYVRGGYTNARFHIEDAGSGNADGFRVAGGGQFGIGGKAYVGGEYRYSNYEAGIERHQVALTVGTRF